MQMDARLLANNAHGPTTMLALVKVAYSLKPVKLLGQYKWTHCWQQHTAVLILCTGWTGNEVPRNPTQGLA